MINEAIIEKIKPGATVRVFEIIKEGEKQRTSRFEGLVLARKHGKEAGASFTVRSVVDSVGVEKVFPIFSPTIDRVEIMASPKKVKRSKLYYLRDVSKKGIRKKLATVFRRDKATISAKDMKNMEKVAKEDPKKEEPKPEAPVQEKVETKEATEK